MSQTNLFLNRIDNEINLIKSKIEKLENKKKAFIEVCEKFPNIVLDYNYGHFYTKDNIQSQVSCMNLHMFYDAITVEFFISPTKTNGYKIYVGSNERYAKNYFNIATIKTVNYKTRERLIKVLNYDSLISDECPSKKKFLKRIKLYLMKKLKETNSNIDPTSFNYEMFSKLLLLK